MELALVLKAGKNVQSENMVSTKSSDMNLPMVFVAKAKFGSHFGATCESVVSRNVTVVQYQ